MVKQIPNWRWCSDNTHYERASGDWRKKQKITEGGRKEIYARVDRIVAYLNDVGNTGFINAGRLQALRDELERCDDRHASLGAQMLSIREQMMTIRAEIAAMESAEKV
jgi:hypothetical protein